MITMKEKAGRLLGKALVVDGLLAYYDLEECGWKYETAERIAYQTDIYPDEDICFPAPSEKDGVDEEPWVALSKSGLMVFREGYTWDGASGPTIDTKSAMRGPLIHDGGYQLIGGGMLPEKWRKRLDEMLEEWCRRDGMRSWRARLWWWVVDKFGASAAKPGRKDPVVDKIRYAP